MIIKIFKVKKTSIWIKSFNKMIKMFNQKKIKTILKIFKLKIILIWIKSFNKMMIKKMKIKKKIKILMTLKTLKMKIIFK